MASRTTKQLILVNKPSGMPVLDGPEQTFKVQTVELPELKDGEVLCKVLYFSNDAGQRGFIQSTVSDERLYVPPVPLNTPMRSGVVAEVIESKSPKIQVGEMLMDYHMGIWSELCILSDATAQQLQPLPNNLPLTYYLGTFGGSGLAAYTGLLYAGNLKRDSDSTVVVSAAAGAVGSMAVQIAKKIFNVKRVVGIAGTDEKCAWVKSLGADECLNYRSPTFEQDLYKATPDEVDTFLDNVGGAVLDAMLPRMKRLGKGTIAVCGAVSVYNNNTKPMEMRNWCEVFSARIAIKGFLMFDYMEHVPAALGELMAAAADGRLNLDGAETVVEGSLEQQPEIWSRLYTGANTGKLVTKLIT